MPTPHISARPGEIAELVIMPGDPKRAERIARERLDDVALVSDVRGIGAWTGTHDGTAMTVMASGMGVPSMSIYATELYREYGVQRICRVGTCGAIQEDVAVGDVVIATTAHTDSSLATTTLPGVSLSFGASFDMLAAAVAQARGAERKVHVGPVFTSDQFYHPRADITPALESLGALAVEMEAAALYFAAARTGREALTALTVSDHLKDHAHDLSADERERLYEAALDAAMAALRA
ncbi:MAG: purine-nucleoside phosphorylase [Propionibacterium sp.]|nr:purine-nucleoside phosphorylase [Propionibacterium sp.]